MTKYHNNFMSIALEQANLAYQANEVPIGAVIIDSRTNKLIAKAHNLCIKNCNFIHHAEINAINLACNYLGVAYLNFCDIYVTLEPCPMCAYAISLSRIRRLYFGCYDKKSGGVENGPRIFSSTSTHHKPEIYGGIMEEASKSLIQKFFNDKRTNS